MMKYGLIGKTLGHSFSKKFFEDFFRRNNIDASYSNIELETIRDVNSVFDEKYSGLNVTIPYKEEVIPFLDELDDVARKIGAVNVISFEGNKKIGFNSDAYGFHQSIKPFLTNKHERAIVFGTGGASKAVIYALRSIGVDPVQISRSPQNGQFSYDEVNEIMVRSCKLIVNTTPLGTAPNVDQCIDLPYQCLTPDHLLVDLVYNPVKTRFLQKGEANGAAILNGESMLKLQALKAWEIWNKDE